MNFGVRQAWLKNTSLPTYLFDCLLVTHLLLLWAAGGTFPAIVKKKFNLQKQEFSEAAWLEQQEELQEEDSRAHEEQGHQGNEQLFVDISNVPGRGNLISEEPGCKEHVSGQQHHGQMGEDSQVHGVGVSAYDLRLHFGRHRVIYHSSAYLFDLWPWTCISEL